MAIVYHAISTHIVNRAGVSNKQVNTGAVTLIQRFGSALNLNIHFQMLFLEGAINENSWGGTTFTRIKAQSHGDMVELAHTNCPIFRKIWFGAARHGKQLSEPACR
ncbi:hypothetical protein GPAL_3539 [Glaciecola pallidula DSM 14239 = ACAM 615]|jgi:hypothetical protein|uniref:Transposase IS801/IS1294 domain-containing protein n=2 Tax=Brumicola TaxID=3160924 RepID=K7A4I2_9ALTE|nr:hypothetical protein GPAL_3539 [Glaciecola pallidula DSM 14239 = ACAM 615]